MNGDIPIDPRSTVSIFQQIVNGVEQQILIGKLKEGDYLPSVRELAITLRINPNTVAKAYQSLQSLDLVEAIRGKGLVVKKFKRRTADTRKDELILAKAEELVALGRTLQVSVKELVEVLQKIGGVKK